MKTMALVCWLFWGGTFALLAADPLTPEQELASFRLADTNLAVALVAAEPAVTSPVAFAWDADGRLFVAEMNDYPVGPTAGRIRLLEDADGDGVYERSTVFADRLAFPNSVLPWNGGVLVTAAPDLLFLKDTDGDGRADERRVLFSGFGEGNQQLRANGLMWGLDNWIYGANGRSDGEVRRTANANAKPVSLRGHDFRFRPDTLEFEPVAGRSQFGVTRDDWGNRFLSWNTVPIRHEVLPVRYLARNPLLAETESLQDILPSGDTGRVFPLAPPPPTFNNESTSHFNALAGLAVFRGDALGEAYRGNAFVGESLRNLVHRRVLRPDGVTFVARRGEEGREFLASTDPWFHPVNFASGPDGALYIADFYRQWVEHPGFVHSKARDEIDWRRGAGYGRVWRVVRKSGDAPRKSVRPKLSSASPAELAAQLENPNGWWRDAAQRLLVERQSQAAVPSLVKLARGSSRAEARLAALFTLDGLKALDGSLLQAVLRDMHPRVREGALRLLEPGLSGDGALAALLLSAPDEPDARARLQHVLCLGALPGESRLPALARFAPEAVTNRWMATAILSGVGSNAWDFLRLLVARDFVRSHSSGADSSAFLERVATLVGAAARTNETEPFLHLVARPSSGVEEGLRLALLAGYGEGLKRSKQDLRERLRQTAAGETDAARDLQGLFGLAARDVTNGAAPTSLRMVAVKILAYAGGQISGNVLLELLRVPGPEAIQAAAVRALADSADASLARAMFDQWGQFAPRVRRQLLAGAVNSVPTREALVAALERGAVAAVELDPAAREALQRSAGPELRARLDGVIRFTPVGDRTEVIRRFQPSLSMSGDSGRGAAHFERLCLQCHAIAGQGSRVGPDLAAIAARPASALLTDILDPGRDVSPDFIAYELMMKDGERLAGIIASETAAGLTLRRPNVPDEVIPRNRIQELQASGKSMMPDGLEQGLTEQDMADLVAFLRQSAGRAFRSR